MEYRNGNCKNIISKLNRIKQGRNSATRMTSVTNLKESYLDEEVDTKAIDVYQHIYSNYYGGGASTYNNYAA